MTHRFQFLIAILVLTGGLASGCSTAASKDGSGHRSRLSPARTASAAKSKSQTPADEKIPVESLAHFATAFSHDLNGEPDQALEEYCKAALANPDYEPIVLEAARRCLRSKKADRAIEILFKSASGQGSSGTVNAWLGLAYAQIGRKEQAVASSRTAIKKMPQVLFAYQNLAQIYLQNAQTNDALKVLDEAAAQPGTDPAFLLDLSDLYGRYARVRTLKAETAQAKIGSLLDRVARLDSKNPLVLHRLGDGYQQWQEFAKAEETYLHLLVLFPDQLIARGKLADLYIRRKNLEKASEQLETIAKQDPTNPRPQSVLGAIALQENRFTNALEHFERALDLNPELETAYYDLARVKLAMDKPEDALALLEKARGKFTRKFALEFFTALAHAALKEYGKAIEHLTTAEILAKVEEPESLDHRFYYQLGAAYERDGKPDRAEESFQKCLALSPDFAEAMNYLGYMWAELDIKLDQARKLIEKAVELEPKNPAFLDSLGWVLFKLKQPKEALEWLKKAADNLPKPDATIYDHLGDVYSALKDFDQAREAWRKSLSVEPDNEQTQRKLKGVSSAERVVP